MQAQTTWHRGAAEQARRQQVDYRAEDAAQAHGERSQHGRQVARRRTELVWLARSAAQALARDRSAGSGLAERSSATMTASRSSSTACAARRTSQKPMKPPNTTRVSACPGQPAVQAPAMRTAAPAASRHRHQAVPDTVAERGQPRAPARVGSRTGSELVRVTSEPAGDRRDQGRRDQAEDHGRRDGRADAARAHARSGPRDQQGHRPPRRRPACRLRCRLTSRCPFQNRACPSGRSCSPRHVSPGRADAGFIEAAGARADQPHERDRRRPRRPAPPRPARTPTRPGTSPARTGSARPGPAGRRCRPAPRPRP